MSDVGPPRPSPSPAPWLSSPLLGRIEAMERGHRRAFGRPLLAGDPQRPLRLRAQELFAAAEVVLAHDGGDPGLDPGPRLIYANRAALRLWRRCWSDMVGMPSRLTAEPDQRSSRSQALTQALRSGGIRGYAGFRIDNPNAARSCGCGTSFETANEPTPEPEECR